MSPSDRWEDSLRQVPRGYEAIRKLADETGENIADLIVLARDNDPFFAGTPTHRKRAEWFAALWEEYGSHGAHLRRIHYRAMSAEEPPERYGGGGPYANSKRCWKNLLSGGRYARYLGLVPPTSFRDARNPDPHKIVFPRFEEPKPTAHLREVSEGYLPRIDSYLLVGFRVPDVELVDGYDYEPADQPVHTELWVEKSTVNDVLLPICRETGTNLVTSVGFQSVTSTVELCQRVAKTGVADRLEAGKPTRILYVSDFDPAGDAMPVAVARQIEFWVEDYAPGADVKLDPLMLTHGQVVDYRLPRKPVKDSDLRKEGFEDRYGEGAVELDALVALHEGDFKRIVRDAITPYRDARLAARLSETARAAEQAARTQWADVIAGEREDLEEIEGEAREIVGRYRARLQELNEDLQEDLGPLKGRVKAAYHAMRTKSWGYDPDLPPRPCGEIDLPDEGEWLYSSDRDYLDQLARYHERQNGEGAAS